MNRRLLTLLFAIALSTMVAHAQIGIYGMFETTRVASAGPGGSTTWFYGPGGGIYYDFLRIPHGPISAGLDLRGNLLSGSQQRYRSGLLGIRVAAHALSLNPYVQGSAGIGGARSTQVTYLSTHYSNKFQYQIAGGLDYTLVSHLDVRAVEIAYGRMTGISGGAAVPATSLFTLSTGLVVRFP